MNATNTTVGGYTGSKMWTDTIPLYDAAIKAAFGDTHVLSHRELLSKSIDANAASAAGGGITGSANNWEWKDVISNIPSEPMIYGGAVWGSGAYDVGNKERQLAIFKFKKYCADRKWFWLQAVGSSSNFAVAYDYGIADYISASGSTAHGGIRPYFLLR